MSETCIKAAHFRDSDCYSATMAAADFISGLTIKSFRRTETCVDGIDFVVSVYYAE